MDSLSTSAIMTFVVASDRDRAKAFYQTVLGLPVTHEDDFACVFDLNGTPLRLSRVEGFEAQQHTVLGWEVDDIASTVLGLREAGVAFNIYEGFGQDDLGIWSPRGSDTKVAWFKDSEGNVLSLTQFG